VLCFPYRRHGAVLQTGVAAEVAGLFCIFSVCVDCLSVSVE